MYRWQAWQPVVLYQHPSIQGPPAVLAPWKVPLPTPAWVLGCSVSRGTARAPGLHPSAPGLAALPLLSALLPLAVGLGGLFPPASTHNRGAALPGREGCARCGLSRRRVGRANVSRRLLLGFPELLCWGAAGPRQLVESKAARGGTRSEPRVVAGQHAGWRGRGEGHCSTAGEVLPERVVTVTRYQPKVSALAL